MKKITILFLFLIISCFSPKVYASDIIFSDDFNDNTLDGWTVQRNAQWFNPSLKCKNGSADAEWKIVDGKLGIKITNSPGCVTEITPDIWIGSLEEYFIDVDMTFVSGTDKNLAFRYGSPSTWYDLKFDSANNTVSYQQIPYSGSLQTVGYPVPNGNTYHLKVQVKSGEIKTWIDNNLVLESTYDPQNEFSPSGKLALQASVGVDPSSEVYFDNVVVTSLDNQPSPTPNSSPSPSPTASSTPTVTPTASPVVTATPVPTVAPTPTPTSFPYFSQYDSQWGTKEYDSARAWATNGKYLFSDWGCAVTSAAMILRHHGIIQLPNGLGTNPGNLHDWLLSVPNGFVNGGEVNWSKVAKATELMHLTNPLWPKLEYKIKNSSEISTLAAELSASPKRPTVLKVNNLGTHFIVAHTYSSPTAIAIADPAYTSRTTLNSYSNIFVSMRTFTPSFTDLSYIMVYTDEKVTPVLERKVGNAFVPVADAEVFLEDSIGSASDGTPARVTKISSLEYAKPPSGEYRVKLSRTEPGISDVTLLTYDLDANEKDLKTKVFIGTSPQYLTVRFTASSAAQTTTAKQVGFAALRNELVLAHKLKYFKKGYDGVDLYALLATSELLYPYSKRTSETAFALYQNTLAKRKLLMNQDFFEVLTADSKLAREQLF